MSTHRGGHSVYSQRLFEYSRWGTRCNHRGTLSTHGGVHRVLNGVLGVFNGSSVAGLAPRRCRPSSTRSTAGWARWVLGVLTAGYIGGLTCPAHVPPLGHALHASPADRRGTPSTHNGCLLGTLSTHNAMLWVVHASAAWLSLAEWVGPSTRTQPQNTHTHTHTSRGPVPCRRDEILSSM